MPIKKGKNEIREENEDSVRDCNARTTASLKAFFVKMRLQAVEILERTLQHQLLKRLEMDQNFASSPSVIEGTIAIVCLKKCHVIHNYNKDGAACLRTSSTIQRAIQYFSNLIGSQGVSYNL